MTFTYKVSESCRTLFGNRSEKSGRERGSGPKVEGLSGNLKAYAQKLFYFFYELYEHVYLLRHKGIGYAASI